MYPPDSAEGCNERIPWVLIDERQWNSRNTSDISSIVLALIQNTRILLGNFWQISKAPLVSSLSHIFARSYVIWLPRRRRCSRRLFCKFNYVLLFFFMEAFKAFQSYVSARRVRAIFFDYFRLKFSCRCNSWKKSSKISFQARVTVRNFLSLQVTRSRFAN